MTLINTHAAKGLILCGFTAEGQVLFSYIAIMQSKAAVCNKGLPHNQGIPTLAMTVCNKGLPHNQGIPTLAMTVCNEGLPHNQGIPTLAMTVSESR